MKIEKLNIQKLRKNPILKSLHAFAKRHGVELYLVGGVVRDLLLNRPTTDYDFTMESNAITFAKEFAQSIRAPCIPLEEKPPTARVIVKPSDLVPSEMCLDFAQYRAASLEDDLCLRDLTINSMAIPLESVMGSDHLVIIDPCDGMKDLETCRLRFPSKQVILDDPLRLLRIYRFGAELGFEMSSHSIALAKKHYGLLPHVSKERIREELLKVLNTHKAKSYLQQMDDIGLLSQVFPNIYLQIANWSELGKFEETPIPTALSSYQREIDAYLIEELGQYAIRESLMKLCILMHKDVIDIGKQLRFSRKAVQFMNCMIDEYLQLADGKLTKKQTIDFLRVTGTEWWGVLLFSAVLNPIPDKVLLQIVDTYYQHVIPVLKQGRLITGEELIRKFQLKEGKEIGIMLKQVEDKQFYGEIRTREDAFALVERLICEEEESL